MQVDMRHLKASLLAVQDAAQELHVLAVGGPAPPTALIERVRIVADNFLACLAPLITACHALSPALYNRAGIRGILSSCDESLGRCSRLLQEVENVLRTAEHKSPSDGWVQCVASQVDTLSQRLMDAARALGVSFLEFAKTLPTDSEEDKEAALLEEAYAKAFDWYKQADAKAQAILAFTGVFLAILLGSVVLKAETLLLRPTSPKLNIAGVAFVLMLYLAGAFLCVLALWSRGMVRTRPGIYFFGSIANFPEDGNDYLACLRELVAAPAEDRRNRAAQLIRLSKNTRRKHRLVNSAVVCSMAALIGTVGMGMVLTLP